MIGVLLFVLDVDAIYQSRFLEKRSTQECSDICGLATETKPETAKDKAKKAKAMRVITQVIS